MSLKVIAITSVIVGVMVIPSATMAGDPSKIMVFGGDNHKVYLGCLSCDKYDSDSVWNAYGDHGSPYSSNSMWNKYGDYGGKYSSYSPCNVYTSDSPVVVDGGGGFYGHLSISSVYSSGKLLQIAQVICKD